MELIGTIVVYIMMACMVAGAIASMVKPESELGEQIRHEGAQRRVQA